MNLAAQSKRSAMSRWTPPNATLATLLTLLFLILSMILAANTAQAQPYQLIYTFTGYPGGLHPMGGLVIDAAGNLYGTTQTGGIYGYGTVFELTPQQGGGWTEQVLYQFNYVDGSLPGADLIFDAAGNLYGTTDGGGDYGWGTVFELMPQKSGGWTEQVLHSFNFGDGLGPSGRLIFDANGDLYGLATGGGDYSWGTAFKLVRQPGGSWTVQVLHSFNYSDGAQPWAGLTFDTAGNLYGTTSGGGSYNVGTVFRLTPIGGGIWTEQVLYNFSTDNKGGWGSSADVIFDALGNLYGTTQNGGAYGYGTVFELMPQTGGNWKERVLHHFNSLDGALPAAGLIFDAVGNLYGTTVMGGSDDYYGYGTAFELRPEGGGGWTEQVLHRFNISDGSGPWAGLTLDPAGNLYGTTIAGGTHNAGTVFELSQPRPCAGCRHPQR